MGRSQYEVGARPASTPRKEFSVHTSEKTPRPRTAKEATRQAQRLAIVDGGFWIQAEAPPSSARLTADAAFFRIRASGEVPADQTKITFRRARLAKPADALVVKPVRTVNLPGKGARVFLMESAKPVQAMRIAEGESVSREVMATLQSVPCGERASQRHRRRPGPVAHVEYSQPTHPEPQEPAVTNWRQLLAELAQVGRVLEPIVAMRALRFD